jgi:hypothetical protein
MEKLRNSLSIPWRFGLLVIVALVAARQGEATEPDWSFNATIIEACSCPMFCQCYFNDKPAAHGGHGEHGGERFCRFNRAFKVNKGAFGSTELAGVKFWMAGDLGGDFSANQMEWAVVTFEPSTTREQRTALVTILGHIYPVKWRSFTVGDDAPMEWSATQERAEARLDGGKTAEVVLSKAQGATEDAVMIKNLKYDGAPRNDGFILMPNEVEAYRVGDKAFEFKGTTGFMVTIDMTSKDLKQ